MAELFEEANRCLKCINKPCMKGCPLNNDIPEVIALYKQGKYEDCYNLLLETNPLGGICSRICPTENQCMKNCTKGKIDRPIKINEIEKFINEYALNNNFEIKKESKRNKKVAIIGSGPSGLSCAFYLAKNGCDVTIYEKYNSLGGLLVRGIPEFRLGKEIVDKYIKRITDLGIKIELNKELGKDIFIDKLEEGYDAIYIGIGANISRKFNIIGEKLEGVYGANELLETKKYPNFKNKVVAIFGGGNVSMDISRTINKMNPKKVYVIYRRSEKEMPSLPSERKEAIEEGIEFIYQTNIIRIIGTDKVKEIELIKTELVDVGLDRLAPTNILGSNYNLKVDYVIKALGSDPELNVVNSLNLSCNKQGYIKVDNYHTSREKIFAGGDLIGTKKTVAFATRDGREAAKQIMEFLGK